MPPLRTIAAACAALVFAAFAIRGLGSFFRSEEDRIRDTIRAIADAAGEKDASGILDRVAADYRDDENLTRREIRALLLYHFLQHRSVDVTIEPSIEVRLSPDKTAVAVFYARFAESAIEGLVRRGEALRFEVTLRKNDKGDWQVVSHRRRAAQ